MADYHSLLSRAVANLPSASSTATRQAIYDRARKALLTQLRTLRPPLPESDIAREERALDAAIAQVEAQFVSPDAAIESPAPAPAAQTQTGAGRPAVATPSAAKPAPPSAAAQPATPTGAPSSADPAQSRAAAQFEPSGVAARPAPRPPRHRARLHVPRRCARPSSLSGRRRPRPRRSPARHPPASRRPRRA